jgi:hypothetical protein
VDVNREQKNKEMFGCRALLSVCAVWCDDDEKSVCEREQQQSE